MILNFYFIESLGSYLFLIPLSKQTHNEKDQFPGQFLDDFCPFPDTQPTKLTVSHSLFPTPGMTEM